MRPNLRERLGIVPIHLVDRGLFFLVIALALNDNLAVMLIKTLDLRAVFRVLRDPFRQNIHRPVERVFHRRHKQLRVFGGFDDKAAGRLPQRLAVELLHRVGKRLKPPFDSEHPPRLFLAFIRRVNILKFGKRLRARYIFVKRLGELALSENRPNYLKPSAFQIVITSPQMGGITHLHLIKAPGRFFAVTRDKRHRAPFVQ